MIIMQIRQDLCTISNVFESEKVKSDGVVFLPFVETSSVMASGTGTCLVL